MGPKPVSFEKELDEIETELAKSKAKKKRKIVDSDSEDKLKRAKGKQPEVSKPVPDISVKKTEKKGYAGLDVDVIRGVNTSLANELSMVKTKLMNMEERESHRESEMMDLRKIVLDQRCLIKKLLTELNRVKEVKVGEAED